MSANYCSGDSPIKYNCLRITPFPAHVLQAKINTKIVLNKLHTMLYIFLSFPVHRNASRRRFS